MLANIVIDYLLKGGPVTWQGKTRSSLGNQDVVPHTESGPFPVWIGVGGSPQSVIRAARHGFSLMLAIIGGSPSRFAPFSQLFSQALESFGRGYVVATRVRLLETGSQRSLRRDRCVKFKSKFREGSHHVKVDRLGATHLSS